MSPTASIVDRSFAFDGEQTSSISCYLIGIDGVDVRRVGAFEFPLPSRPRAGGGVFIEGVPIGATVYARRIDREGRVTVHGPLPARDTSLD